MTSNPFSRFIKSSRNERRGPNWKLQACKWKEHRHEEGGSRSVEGENMFFFWNFKTIYLEFCAVERSLHREGSLHTHAQKACLLNCEGYQICICFCKWSADNSGKPWFQIYHFFKKGCCDLTKATLHASTKCLQPIRYCTLWCERSQKSYNRTLPEPKNKDAMQQWLMGGGDQSWFYLYFSWLYFSAYCHLEKYYE